MSYFAKVVENALVLSQDAPFTVHDIILREGEEIRLKAPGKIVGTGVHALREELTECLKAIHPQFNMIMIEAGQIEARYTGLIETIADGVNTEQEINLRVSGTYYDGRKKISIVIRINAPMPMDLTTLGLHQTSETLIRTLKPGKLLLVAGQMGEGKSTTMYAAVHHLNTVKPQHIATIEDPIELTLPNGDGVILQRQVSPYARLPFVDKLNMDERNNHLDLGDVPDFISGVRGSLRMSISGLMIMEIRDEDTANAAVAATESGLWVIAGIHSNDAMGALAKLINFASITGRADRAKMLATRLHGIHYQKLIPVDAGNEHAKEHGELAMACEVLQLDKAPLEWRDILARNDLQELSKAFDATDSPGAVRFNRSLAQLVQDGVIAKEVAIEVTTKPLELTKMIGGT